MSSDNSADPFADFKLWYYTPNAAAGIVFCVIFGLLTIAHIYRLVKTRTWFCIPFVIGAIFEAVGYGARAAAHSDTESIGPYIIQSILILVAPALLAASIYMVLGRLIRAVRAESYSIIRVNLLTKIFVGGDIFCFMMQSSGGGLIATAKTKSDVNTAEYIILGGLILQIVIFCIFVLVGIIFHKRLRAAPTAASMDGTLPWQRLMLMLYLVSILITIRNIIRVVEYATGTDGYLLTHEWTIYVFDGALMAIVLSVCLMWYISGIRPKVLNDSEHAAVEIHGVHAKTELRV